MGRIKLVSWNSILSKNYENCLDFGSCVNKYKCSRSRSWNILKVGAEGETISNRLHNTDF